jgi:hypothetical protein
MIRGYSWRVENAAKFHKASRHSLNFIRFHIPAHIANTCESRELAHFSHINCIHKASRRMHAQTSSSGMWSTVYICNCCRNCAVRVVSVYDSARLAKTHGCEVYVTLRWILFLESTELWNRNVANNSVRI